MTNNKAISPILKIHLIRRMSKMIQRMANISITIGWSDIHSDTDRGKA